MKVSIIIPNWNGEEKLKRNLPKVLKVRGANEVIVSDDASTDGSVERLKQNFPEVKLVIRKKNGGFSSNVNTGVNEAKGDLLFLLNTDALPSIDCIEKVLPHFKDKKVFSVSCNTGGSWAWAKWEKGFFWHKQASEKVDQAHQTLWASGGSGVFRKSIWEEMGGLDELYNPFYWEDVDLGYRATKRGYINLWDPAALVVHYKEKGVIASNFSQSTIERVSQRNQLIFIWENITSSKLIRQHKEALVKILLTHPKYWFVFSSTFTKLPQILKKRKTEQKSAKLSDEEILAKFKLL